MSNIPKVSSVFQQPVQKSSSSTNATGGQWSSSLSSATPQARQTSSQVMNMQLERAPNNVTNQNGMLSQQQMAQHISNEQARRNAQNRALRRKGKKTGYPHIDDLDDGISEILGDNREGTFSWLDGNDPETIKQFLAFFQQEIEKHLAGVNFGQVQYDPEMLAMYMAKYGYA